MTVTDSNVRRRPPTPARASRPGRGLRDRPGGLLAAVRRAARARRGLPAARRGARRASSAARWSRPAWSTRAQAARAAGDRFARRAGRPRALPRGHLRDLEPGAAGRAGRQGAGRAARPAADGDARLREHRHRRVAGQLRGLLRAGARGRVHARADPLRHRRRHDRRRRARVGEDRAPGCARPASRARCAAPRIGFLGHTYPGMLDMYSDFTAVHAQLGAHVEVLEIDDLGARVARPTDAEVAAKEAEIRAMFDFADPVRRPDRRARSRTTQLDWSARVAVGLDRLVGGLRARRLTYYYRGARRQRGRAARRRRDRRQLAADRARHPDRRRGRPQDQPRPADPRPARRRRLVHRVLRARLRRGLRADGPRRAGPRRDRPGAARRCARSSSTTASAAPA